MAFNIIWDKSSEKTYETGVDRGVLYPQVGAEYPKGIPWNGLTAFNASPTGAESTPLYADNIKYLNLVSAEEFNYSIEAYTYPKEFEECDGSKEAAPGVTIGQQDRKPFGFSCRTIVGNDTEGSGHGYKLHLVYNSLAAPSEKGYSTVNDNPEAITFSWECKTTPVEVVVDGFDCKPTATMTINSREADPAKFAELEKILYGEGETEGRLPLPTEVINLFKGESA